MKDDQPYPSQQQPAAASSLGDPSLQSWFMPDRDRFMNNRLFEDMMLNPASPNNGGDSSLAYNGSSPSGPEGVHIDDLSNLLNSEVADYEDLTPLIELSIPLTPYRSLNEPHMPQIPSPVSQPNSQTQNQHHQMNIFQSNDTSSYNSNNNNPNTLLHGASGGSTGGSVMSSPSFPSPNSVTSLEETSHSMLLNYDQGVVSTTGNMPSMEIGNICPSDIDQKELIQFLQSGASSLMLSPDETGRNEALASTEIAVENMLKDLWEDQNLGQDMGLGAHNQQVQGSNNETMFSKDATVHNTSASGQSFLNETNLVRNQSHFTQNSYPSGNNPMFHQEMKPQYQQQQSTPILQSRLQQAPAPMVRMPPNGCPMSSPSHPQLPESTTQFGLKIEPYNLNPGSPYIDPNTGELTHRVHLNHPHPSPQPVVTSSTRINENPGGTKCRKPYKVKNPHSNSNGPNFHHASPDGNGYNMPLYNNSPSSCYDPSSSTRTGSQVRYHSSSYNGSHYQPRPHHWHKEQSKLGVKAKRKSSKMPSSSDLGSPLDSSGKGKPVHQCPICGRAFLNKSNIKVHMRTHTGEKPFKCEVCVKPFRQKAHLLKHVSIHRRQQQRD